MWQKNRPRGLFYGIIEGRMKELFVKIKNRICDISEKTVAWAIYAALLPVSAAFIYVFSLWTSPLYKNWYGCDASFFTLVGRGILEGKVPYRDFYDLKGPYFFFIEALGQFIHRGLNGIFIVQIIALYFSLVLMIRIGKLYISPGKSLGISILFLWPYASLLWGGNCLEEFCLPLNLLAIFLNLRIYGLMPSDTPEHEENRFQNPNVVAAVTGLCFTVMAFSKITAGAPLIGLVIGVFILHLMRKEYKKLAFYILYFLLGAFGGMVPLIIYYGYHGCILKMLYCTFIFGFKRSSDLSNAFSMSLEVKLAGVIFSIVFTILHMLPMKNKEERLPVNIGVLVLPMCLITYIVLHLGDSFIYYFITGMPCLVTALILMNRLYDPLVIFKNFRQTLCWLLLFVFAFHYSKDTLNQINVFTTREAGNEFHGKYYENSKNMGALIPLYDKNSVFSFDIDMQWFEINDMMPCNKYMVNLQYFISLEPSIEKELFDYFNTTPPKWMICSNTLPDYLPQMDALVRSKYDCIYSTDVGLVYLLRQ